MKKRIITVLIALLTVIPLVLVSPKAATGATLNGSGISNYGSYTYQFSVILEQTEVSFGAGADNIGFSIPLATGSTFSLHYQFKDTYTGYVQFTLKSNTNIPYRLDQCYWGVNGGYFNSSYMPSLTTVSNSKQFRIFVYNATEFTFTIVSDNVNTFHPNSTQYTGFGVSSFGYGLTDVGDVPDIAADIDFYLPGMSSSLTNIDSNTSTMASDIAIIKGYLDGLEGYTDQIEPYLNQLININKIQSFDIWQHNVLFWASSYENVNFDSSMPYINYLSSYHDSDYDLIHRFCVGPNSTQTLYFYSSTSLNLNNIFLYYRGSDPEVSITRTYSLLPPMNMYMYRLDFTNSTNSLSYFEVEFNKTFILYPIFWGDINNIPDDVHYLFGEELNNTYTRLLQLIANGVGGTSYDTSQYEQYEQTIDSLNDNMRDNFNNSESSFQNNLNNILTPDQTSGGSNTIFEQFHFNAINGVFTGFLGQLFNAAPVLQYLLLFGLLLLVLGVFI